MTFLDRAIRDLQDEMMEAWWRHETHPCPAKKRTLAEIEARLAEAVEERKRLRKAEAQA